MITNRQAEYRAYLSTPVWKQKRMEALSHYGAICNRCGDHGTDVHHKTYDRVGGNEILSDLEILCRGCHVAHHRVEKIGKKRKKARRTMHVKGVIAYMTKSQRAKLEAEHGGSVYIILYNAGRKYDRARDAAMKMLGINNIFGIPYGGKKRGQSLGRSLTFPNYIKGKYPSNINH